MAKIVLALVALMLAMGALGHSVMAASTGGNSAPSSRVCFPFGKWNGGTVPYSKAPCARITRVYEDGSFKFAVSDHDGTVRYSGGVGAADR